MKDKKHLRSLLFGSAAAACFAVPTGVMAQDGDAADTDDVVIVTGSRIGRAGFDTLQPATQVDSDFVDARGFANIADALNEVPTFGTNFGTGGANPSGGQSAQNLGQNFVNIFGLGSERTLTLINGRRAVGGNAPASSGANAGLQVDLNIIPTAMIDRIETIYTGGAPIYGSDAVAGTVNVILKDDFEGMELDAQYGIAEEGDAQHYRIRTVVGGNFDDGRGNAVVSAEYSRTEGLLASERPDVTQFGTLCETRFNIFGFDGTAPNDDQPNTASCVDGVTVWTVTNTGTPLPVDFFTGHPQAFNSSLTSAAQARLDLGPTANDLTGGGPDGDMPNGVNDEDEDMDGIPDSFNNDIDRDGVFDSVGFLPGPAQNNFFVDGNNNPVLFDLNGRDIITFDEAQLGNPRQLFFSQGAGRDNPYVINLNDTNTLISPLERYIISGKGHYDISDNLRFISEVLFARSEAVDELNQPQWSNAAFGRNANIIIKLDNPYLDPGVSDLFRSQMADNITDGDPMDPMNLPDGIDDNGCDDPMDDDPPDCVPDGMADLNIDTDGDGIPDDIGFFLTRTNEDIFEGSASHRSQDTFRIVTGLEGDMDMFGRDWTWESVFYFGQNNSVADQAVINQNRYALAIDAVVDPTSGQIVCRSTIDPPPDVRDGNINSSNNSDVTNCLPINVLGFGNHDAETRAYLIQNQFQTSQIQQLAIELNAGGEIFDLPGGAVAVAGGFTHRRERASFRVDQANAIDLPGRINQAPSASEGGFNTTEVYVEGLIPLFGDDFSPLPFIDQLWLEPAIRFVDNTVAGDDITWVAGGRMDLNLPLLGEGGLRVRGNFTRSIRAPGILELFLPQSGGATFAQDPCDFRFIDAGPNPAVRRANCEGQAATAGFNLTDFQSFIVNSSKPTIVGGNPNLRNEVADSWTVGGVITPSFLSGFQASIDWTSIVLNDAIVQITGTQLMNACYDTSNFPNQFCDSIVRDATFQVTSVELPFQNAAVREFAGLISAVSYNFPAADMPFFGDVPGDIGIQGQFFHTHKHQQVVGSDDLDFFSNEEGGERGTEKFRYQLNLNYDTDRWNFLWQLNSNSPTTFNLDGSREGPNTDDASDPLRTNRAFRSHNFSMRYRVNDTLTARFIVNNVFDNRDNVLESASAVGNNIAYRDAVGRRFIFGINASF